MQKDDTLQGLAVMVDMPEVCLSECVEIRSVRHTSITLP